jgi:hypothetical protein
MNIDWRTSIFQHSDDAPRVFDYSAKPAVFASEFGTLK